MDETLWLRLGYCTRRSPGGLLDAVRTHTNSAPGDGNRVLYGIWRQCPYIIAYISGIAGRGYTNSIHCANIREYSAGGVRRPGCSPHHNGDRSSRSF
jgi:hypothetical protein